MGARNSGARSRRARSIAEELWAAVVERLKDRGFALRNPGAVESLRIAMDTGLIHGESVLLIDLTTCTKCDDCVRACAATHGGTPRFVREGIRVSHYSVPTACYQCTDPVCMIGCPTGAISRPLGTLQVTHQSGHLHRVSPLRQRVPVAQHRSGAVLQQDPGPGDRARDKMRPLRWPGRRSGLRADVPAWISGACGPQGSPIVRTLFS